MKVRIAAVLATLASIALADTPQDQRWASLIDTGKHAMESRQYVDAEKSFGEGLKVAETFNPDDARVAISLLFLAQASNAQSKKDQAEDLARRAVVAMDGTLRRYKPTKAEEEFYTQYVSAKLFDGAADIFAANQKDADAESLYQRVIAVRENFAQERKQRNNDDWLRSMTQLMTSAHGESAKAEEKLASIYFRQHKFAEAEALYAKGAKAWESDPLGSKRYVARDVGNQAICLAAQKKNSEAEALFQSAIAMYQQLDPPDQQEAARLMQNYALLLKSSGRENEAKDMLEKARAILRKSPPNGQP